MEKKLTWQTRRGCFRLMAIFMAIILVFGFMGILFESDFGKLKVSQVKVDFRGAALSGELYYPVGTSSHDNLPALVLAHGGANTFGMEKNIAAEMARRGFVVFSFSAYSQGLSEQPYYDESDQGANGLNINKTPAGFMDAVNYVKSLAFVDETRIGIFGHSMGSYRGDYVILEDCGYLTLNDQLINILHDTFGQSFTEEEIYDDADALAAQRLDEKELAHYNDLRDAAETAFNAKVKAMVVTGIDRAYGNDVATVSVGGYEVSRTLQCDLAFIQGEYDEFIFGFGMKDYNKAGWYSDDTDLQMGKWYVLDDRTQSNQIVGDFFSDRVTNNQTLETAMDGRRVRVFYNTPGEDHCKETISVKTNAAMAEFFSQALSYNCGELTDASTAPMDNYNSLFTGRVICNTITVLALVGLLLSIAAALIVTEDSFVPGKIEEGSFTRTIFDKKQYWIYSAILFAVAFFALYRANHFWWAVRLGWFSDKPAWPLSRPCCIVFFFLVYVAVGSLVCILLNSLWQKKHGNGTGIAALNIKIKFSSILKYLLCAIMLTVIGYMVSGTLDYLFGQELRIWQTAFCPMPADRWFLVLKYALVLMPMFFLMSCGVNYMVRTDLPEWKDTLITVLLNSLPVWLCCIISAIVVNSKPFYGLFFCDFVCCYSLVGSIPILTYINRKLYKLTNSVWLGTGDIYYPQTMLGVLLGM